MGTIFDYHVKNKDGETEIEICYDGERFSVDYMAFDRYLIRSHRPFPVYSVGMHIIQVWMLLYAYGQEEFKKFDKSLNDWMTENGKDINK